MTRMGFLGFLILVGAIAILWRKVRTLEVEIARLAEERSVDPPAPRPTISPATAAPPAYPDPAFTLAQAEREIVRNLESDPLANDEPQAVPRRVIDFEDLFGRRLPIWVGGATLAVAGFFLVRWSIEAGLLTPAVRVALAGLFGAALLAGAEIAYRWRERVADPRVAQALAGAGLATLYAAFYLAGSTYGLIGPALAFIGLASVTAAAIGLSFRFGLPSAVLALVGGFAAPALVSTEDANLPLLALYLALVTGGLTVTGRRQGRPWLGVAALAGGLGWGGLLVAGDAVRMPEIAAIGLLVVLLGSVLPAFVGQGDERENNLVRWSRPVAGALAALQLAVLVARAGFGPLEWGLYLLLGASLAWFGWRDRTVREGGAIAALVGVSMLAVWTDADVVRFAIVTAGLVAVFAAPPLALLWRGRGRSLEMAQSTGVALGVALAALGHFGAVLPQAPQPLMGLALLALAAIPAIAAWRSTGLERHWRWLTQGAAALLAYAALAQVLPENALAWTAAVLAAGIAWRAGTLAGAVAMFAALAALWAVEPAGRWVAVGLAALTGKPPMLADLPDISTTLLRLVPISAALSVWRAAAPPRGKIARIVVPVAGMGTVIAAHVLYRHVFAAIAGQDFIATGVMQRAGWEFLLVAAGWVALGRGRGRAATVPIALALAHFAAFAMVLHNPLWSTQAVGPIPIANALMPMYASGFAALWLAGRLPAVEKAWSRPIIDGLAMVVVALLALSQLRQAFAGPILVASPVDQTEDLLRSLVGIVLAIAFLLWGTKSGLRSWRIGSLVTMVLAVLKVFLVDAAGLQGLARIGSFMALGFSLIGIGWFYNRQLRSETAR